MRGESYHRALDQKRGSGRPSLGPTMMVNADGTTSPVRTRQRRDWIDIGFKVFAACLIWAGVFGVLFAFYAVAVLLLKGGR